MRLLIGLIALCPGLALADLLPGTTVETFNQTLFFGTTVQTLGDSQALIPNLGLSFAQPAKSDFVYGFGDGMTYQQKNEEGLVSNYSLACSTPTAFDLEQTSTTTFDSATCQDVLNTIENALYEMSLSTPTVIPPEP